MQLQRRQIVFSLGAAAATVAAPARVGAAEAGVGSDEILIGQNITLEAGRNAYGTEVQGGIRACLEEVNRTGGVQGRQIKLRTLDDENDSGRAAANAKQLLAEGSFVLFGSIEGGPSTAVMQVAVEQGVPFVGPMAGSPGLRRPHQRLVYPVRAEHREEFRALMTYGASLGLRRVALFHADSAVGREHLGNVEKLAAQTGMTFGGGLVNRSGMNEQQLAAAAAEMAAQGVDLMLNHGSASLYGKLITQARKLGVRTQFWGVNSGSTPLAAALGPIAHGMVFSQIVPNPRSGKTTLAREYQTRHARSNPGQPLSYGGLEGFMTAKALVLALRAAGTNPTRASLQAGLQNFEADLGGLRLRWQKGDHSGSAFVDLAIVANDGRFVQ